MANMWKSLAVGLIAVVCIALGLWAFLMPVLGFGFWTHGTNFFTMIPAWALYAGLFPWACLVSMFLMAFGTWIREGF